MKKRVISVILSAFIISCMAISFSGCNDISNNNSSSQTNSESNISSNNSSKTESSNSDFNYEYDENYTYKINYRYVEDYYFSAFAGEYLNLYYNIVDAVAEYKGEVEISSNIEDLYYSDNVIKGFMNINPLQSFVKSMEREDNTIYITYNFDEKNHKSALQFMDKRLNSILENNIKSNYTDFQRVMAVYTYVSSNFSYDFSYNVENNDKIDIYDFLKNGSGVCHSFSRTCKLLLFQYGISTYEARAYSPQGQPHEWFLAEIDGEWYHFDPTYEANNTGGLGLKYFAMSEERRFNNGGFMPQFVAGISPITTTPPTALKTNFDIFDNVVSYELDIDGTINAKLSDGTSAMIDYSDYVINE